MANQAFAQFCKGVHHGMVYNGPQKPRLLISQKNILEYVLGLDEWQQVLNESISKWLPFKELESESKLIDCRAELSTINGIQS